MSRKTRSRQSWSTITGAVAMCVLSAWLALSDGVMAQNVSLGKDFIHVPFAAGNGGVLLHNSGQVVAGGSGTHGSILLVNSDLNVTVSAFASTGDLALGGGTEDGDLFLTGSDGITLNVRAHGDDAWVELGSIGEDGDLTLKNNLGQLTVRLDGQSATAEQDLPGNGFLKAWARIKADGTVHSCWKCNMSSSETRRLSLGKYEVSFSPLGTDIRSRPRNAILDTHSAAVGGGVAGMIELSDQTGDNSTVLATVLGHSGGLQDRAFTLFVY